MSNPLEISLKVGEKEHRLAITPGDPDGAMEALDRVGFMVNLFIDGAPGAGKRPVAKPAEPKRPVTSPGTPTPDPKALAGSAK
jgi:hypothetical protein